MLCGISFYSQVSIRMKRNGKIKISIRKKGKRNDSKFAGRRKGRRRRLISRLDDYLNGPNLRCVTSASPSFYHPVLYSERTPMSSSHGVERRGECISIWILYFILQNKWLVILFKVMKTLNWRQPDPSLLFPPHKKKKKKRVKYNGTWKKKRNFEAAASKNKIKLGVGGGGTTGWTSLYTVFPVPWLM